MIPINTYVQVKDLSHNMSAYRYEQFSNKIGIVTRHYTYQDIVNVKFNESFTKREFIDKTWQNTEHYNMSIPCNYLKPIKYIPLIE